MATFTFEVSDAQYEALGRVFTNEQKTRELTQEEEAEAWVKIREAVGTERYDKAVAQSKAGHTIKVVRVKEIRKRRPLKMPARRPDLPREKT